MDYNFSAKDRLALKYYFQNVPNTTPFAQSSLLWLSVAEAVGRQPDIQPRANATSVTPNLTWEQRLGFLRMKDYASTSQFLNPSSVGDQSVPRN